jgi:hypothetical protein
MRKRSLAIVLVLAAVLVLASAGTALGWAHGKNVEPILDSYEVVAVPINDTWYWVDCYFDTSGAKPVYAVYGTVDGKASAKITRADLVAGYKKMLVPKTATGIYLETRKGVQSNILPFELP